MENNRGYEGYSNNRVLLNRTFDENARILLFFCNTVVFW
jgi:hypothetical protein